MSPMTLRESEHRLLGSTAPQRGLYNKPAETKTQREKRLAKAKAERQHLRQRFAEDDDAVLTVKEWCTLNGFSSRTGRRILKSGNGPVVTKLTGKLIGVSRRNNRAWQQSRSR
jgi:hypothetical protein